MCAEWEDLTPAHNQARLQCNGYQNVFEHVSVLVTPLQMTTGEKKKSHTFESERHNSLIYCVNFDT